MVLTRFGTNQVSSSDKEDFQCGLHEGADISGHTWGGQGRSYVDNGLSKMRMRERGVRNNN
jgi:hypothetical protein